MAEVQLALQRGPAGFEKLVVVKLVHENLATQKAFVDMLLDEARVAALVKHPNVVDIYDLGEAGGRYFIAMEYLEGEPLLAVLRAGRDGQRLDVLSTARLIADTAEGLDAAHELRSMAGDPIELVHHDVSLGNIVVLYNGQVKLVDFGVAKATQSAKAQTRIQGKFSYMAPEKLRGGPGDRRSDIWSLGCVLWEALTLKRLFKGGNDSETMAQVLETAILAPSAVNGDVPVDFDAIALRSLERDPDRRYPTAKIMATELEEVLRAHGYAAKNDRIARYMQATFESHIAARKKLLQEVSSKGRASPDIVEAAFHHDGALASGSLPAPGEPAAPQRPAGGRAVEAAAPLAPADAPPADAGREHTEVEPQPDNRWLAYPAAAGALLAVLVVTSLIANRGEAPASRTESLQVSRETDAAAIMSAAEPRREPGPPPRPAVAPAPPPRAAIEPALPGPAAPPPRAAIARALPGPAAPPPRAATATAPPASAPEASSAVAAAPPGSPSVASQVPAPGAQTDATSAKPHGTPRHPVPRPAPPVRTAADKPNPDELFKVGVQAWVRGDTRTALASYKHLLQTNPGYSAAWRNLGLVHERLGDRPAAHAAFQRYLQLAPGAADAPEIRARLEAP
jgi:serine/threonine-protein kinase